MWDIKEHGGYMLGLNLPFLQHVIHVIVDNVAKRPHVHLQHTQVAQLAHGIWEGIDRIPEQQQHLQSLAAYDLWGQRLQTRLLGVEVAKIEKVPHFWWQLPQAIPANVQVDEGSELPHGCRDEEKVAFSERELRQEDHLLHLLGQRVGVVGVVAAQTVGAEVEALQHGKLRDVQREVPNVVGGEVQEADVVFCGRETSRGPTSTSQALTALKFANLD